MGRRGGWGLDPLGVKYLRPDCAGGWAELGHIGLECWYLILKRELEPSGARGTCSLHVDCGGGWFHIFRFNNFFVHALYFVLGSLHASVYEISEQLFFHAYHMKKDCLGGVFVYELSGYF